METRHQGVPVSRLQCRRAVVEVGDAPTLNSRWNVDCAERVQSGHQHSRWNVDRAESAVGAELVQGREEAHVCLWVTSGQRWEQNRAGGKTQEQLESSRGSEIPAERNAGPC